MPLYCYIVETGMYEDVEAHILGHQTKYSQKEFDNICIKLTEKYGDVEEIEYFSNYDKSDVEEIRYNIPGETLIEYLIKDYGFVELNVPVNDGVNHIEVSRTPVPKENLRKVVVKPLRNCPAVESVAERHFFCKDSDIDSLELKHFNARCIPKIRKGPVD